MPLLTGGSRSTSSRSAGACVALSFATLFKISKQIGQSKGKEFVINVIGQQTIILFGCIMEAIYHKRRSKSKEERQKKSHAELNNHARIVSRNCLCSSIVNRGSGNSRKKRFNTPATACGSFDRSGPV